jgi:alpha-glucosidase (family GH31 glycosyl hydrolase)
VDAPLNRLPIFVRGGTILITSADPIQCTNEFSTDRYQIDLYPPYPAETQLYEDDGLTTAYLNGAVSITRLSCREEENTLCIQMTPLQCGYNPPDTQKDLKFILHASRPVTNVQLDGGRLIPFDIHLQSQQVSFTVNADFDRPHRIEIQSIIDSIK